MTAHLPGTRARRRLPRDVRVGLVALLALSPVAATVGALLAVSDNLSGPSVAFRPPAVVVTTTAPVPFEPAPVAPALTLPSAPDQPVPRVRRPTVAARPSTAVSGPAPGPAVVSTSPAPEPEPAPTTTEPPETTTSAPTSTVDPTTEPPENE